MDRTNTPLGSNEAHSTMLRGGQIFFHNARMMWQLLSRIALICCMATSSIAIGWSIVRSDDLAVQMYTVKTMADVHVMMGSPSREMRIEQDGRQAYVTTAAEARQLPYVVHHANRFKEHLYADLSIGGAVGVVLFIGMFIWFTRSGARLGSDQHVRGAKLVTQKQLASLIARFNRKEARKRRSTVRKYKPYSLAGIEYPYRTETTHTLIAGTTGSGKTQIMHPLLEEIRKRGDRAIIYDKMRSFIPTYYDPARGDVILNPMDERCANWTPFQDAKSFEDYRQIAAALIPENPRASDQFWDQSARLLFACTAHKLHQKNNRSLDDLLKLLLRVPVKSLYGFLSDTLVASSIENAKTASSVRATIASHMASLISLNRPGLDLPSFSIRQWVQDEDSTSFLFLSSRSDQHEVLRPLISTWMDIALNAIMAQERDPDRTIWLILDELPSLNRLSTLEKGLAEGRQYGAAYVIGIQSLSQLKSIYGPEVSTTIASLCRTKAILNLADPETAKMGADFIGRAELLRAQRGVSFGAATVRDGASYTMMDKVEHLVMPEDLMQLENLHGYLIPAMKAPAASIKLEYKSPPQYAQGYIAREDDAEDIVWSHVGLIDDGEAGITPETAVTTMTAASIVESDPDVFAGDDEGLLASETPSHQEEAAPDLETDLDLSSFSLEDGPDDPGIETDDAFYLFGQSDHELGDR